MSSAEQNQIVSAWEETKKRLRPAVIDEDSTTTAEYLRNYMKRNQLAWSVENVLLAVWSLHSEGKIMWLVEPVPAPATPRKSLDEIDAEFRAREIARAQREKIENAKPFTQSAEIDKEKGKEAIAKLEQISEIEINSVIQSYECYRGPNQRDHATMNMVTSVLHKFVAANPKASRVLLLGVVKQAISELSDRPKLGETENIITSVLARRKVEEAKSPAQKAKDDEDTRWRQRPR